RLPVWGLPAALSGIAAAWLPGFRRFASPAPSNPVLDLGSDETRVFHQRLQIGEFSFPFPSLPAVACILGSASAARSRLWRIMDKGLIVSGRNSGGVRRPATGKESSQARMNSV